jgi:hypothetical protein
MKLSTSLLLPALVGAAAALSDANVYIFQRDESPRSLDPPTLTPEQARLVFAHRLATSQYHGLGDASDSTLSYVNNFGGRRDSFFEDAANDTPVELVLIVEGVSSKTAKPLMDEWSTIKPAFTISNPPSMTANKNLASDLNQQCGQGNKKCALPDAINPFDGSCWNGKSKVIHFDLIREKVRILHNGSSVFTNNSSEWSRSVDVCRGEIDQICKQGRDERGRGSHARIVEDIEEPVEPIRTIRKSFTETN